MPRRILLLLSALAMLCTLPAAAPVAAQPTAPSLETEFDVPGVIKLKFPAVAAREGVVHVGATTNFTTAIHLSKPEAATSFSAPFEVGQALGQADYSSASLFIDSQNRLFYVFGSIDEKRIKLRIREANGTWGPERTVAQGEPFPIFPRVAANGNQVFVVWQDVERPPLGKVSTDGGATFSSRFNAGSKTTFSAPPAITVGPSGQAAFVYTDNQFRIYAGIWNGSAFVEEAVTPSLYANPSISYGPDGKLYVGYRGIADTGTATGAWYSERQTSGGWSAVKIANGPNEGAVNVVVDPSNTKHFAWQGKVSGEPRIFYAYQPAGQPISAPASGAGGAVFNPQLAVGNTNTGLAHVVSERFDGNDQTRLRYYLFEYAPPVQKPSATPGVPGGTSPVLPVGEPVTVTLTNPQNNPTEVRWRWLEAPSNTADDSGGWRPFTASISVPTRSDLPVNCSAVPLFLQVRNSGTEGDPTTVSVRFDGAVDAAVAGSNPYAKRKQEFSDGAAPADLVSNGGASDGHVDYTRAPVFYLELRSQADCSGLAEVATGTSSAVSSSFQVEDDTFSNIVPLPSLPTSEGPTSVVIRVSDEAGNTRDYPEQFIYDVTPPTLSSTGQGVLTLGTTPSTLLVRLNFNGVQVSDNLYPSPGFWGVWVANSRTPIADPLSSPDLFWVPVQTPGAGGTFSVPSWSLASGLPDSQVVPGTYYVYVRFLDGAGNPSAAYLSAQTTLTAVTRPAIFLPMLRR